MNADENLSGGEGLKLSLDQQLNLVSSSNDLDGLKKFGDSLASGQLEDTLPLHLSDSKSYRPPSYEGEPHRLRSPLDHMIEYRLEQKVEEPTSHKDLVIDVDTSPDSPHQIKLTGYHKPGQRYQHLGDPYANKGLNVNFAYQYLEDVNGVRKIQFDGGIIYVQTSTNAMAYDAVVVVGSDGRVEGIMPPGHYHSERIYGSVIRKAEERARNQDLPLEALHHLDQLTGSLDDAEIKLAHQRKPDEYSALEQEVAKQLGLDLERLYSGRINPLATLEATLNNPIQTAPAVKDSRPISVPPIVFEKE